MSDIEFKKEFKKIYEGLEDGTIKSKMGIRFKDKEKYYNTIFRSKPFEMLGETHLVKEIMEFHSTKSNNEVRFFEEETFRQIVEIAIKPEDKLLMWLGYR